MTIIRRWRGDITTLAVDAIVAAGNKDLSGCRQPGHCIDAAIFLKAGEGLFKECATLGGCKTSYAKITNAYNLPCKYVIHTVGPIYDRRKSHIQCEQLGRCYINVLNLAARTGIKTIAFCCISTGIFSFPNEKACDIAVFTVYEWVKENPGVLDEIIFDVWTEMDDTLYMIALTSASRMYPGV